jgi:hypothetical protein
MAMRNRKNVTEREEVCGEVLSKFRGFDSQMEAEVFSACKPLGILCSLQVSILNDLKLALL